MVSVLQVHLKTRNRLEVLSRILEAPGTCWLPPLPYPFFGSGRTSLLAVPATCQAHPTPGPLHLPFLPPGALLPRHLPGWFPSSIQRWSLLTIHLKHQLSLSSPVNTSFPGNS